LCLAELNSDLEKLSDELPTAGNIENDFGLSYMVDLLRNDNRESLVCREEPTTQRKTTTAKLSASRQATPSLLPLSKIVKNDIRRHMATMFMNTINSADLSKIQSYFRTFVVGPCMFVAEHQAKPEMRLPDKLITAGPRLMSHYVLGCFVQYPDMVMSLRSSRIVSNPRCAGSKIIMEMDIRGTKLNDLEFSDWVPQATVERIVPPRSGNEGSRDGPGG
jgi:hypothetical protein